MDTFKDLYVQVTKDYAYVQGITLKNDDKETDTLLIIEPDYIEQDKQMVFSKNENQYYIVGKRGGCWGLKLQNISKKTLIVMLSKDEKIVANMILKPQEKYFMNNYNITGKNYFEIQENKDIEDSVQKTIDTGTFEKHKNEYMLMVYPKDKVENYKDYKYVLQDFIAKKNQMNQMFERINEQNDIIENGFGSIGMYNRGSQIEDQIEIGMDFGGMGLQNNSTNIPQIQGNNEREGGSQRQRRQGSSFLSGQLGSDYLDSSRHTTHKMSTQRNKENLRTSNIEYQVDQCMKFEFVIIINKSLEVNMYDDKEKLVELLVEKQVQQQWKDRMEEGRIYVDNQCIICFEKSGKVFCKCGHGCSCENCYKDFKKQQVKTCPLCRNVIQGVYTIQEDNL